MLFDCFIFFNELELLEVRLETVPADKFVLVEATRTFSGHPKPLVYDNHKRQFAKFADRIVHVVVEDMPETGCWERETHQRNAIMRGLAEAQPNDIIMISDVDEIPKPEKVELLPQLLAEYPVWQFKNQMYWYWLNNASNLFWVGTRALLRKDMAQPEAIRMNDLSRTIEDAGWHFSFMGGKEKIREKVAAYSHQEYNSELYLSDENLERAMQDAALDLFKRPVQFWRVAVDEQYPQFIQQNLHHFQTWLL